VVFIHGLWLLATSWAPWRAHFEEAGYATLAPGWPGDPETVDEAKAGPDAFAGQKVGPVADHLAEVIGGLTEKPAIIGHSFGGMFTQMLAGRGLASVSVSIDPAPYRGILPLPLSTLMAASPVLGNPLNRGKAVALTYDQFRYAFANAVDDDEARSLYETHAVAAPATPLFQGAMANFNPLTQVRVDSRNPARGPMLVISGQKDHTVPWAIANATYKKQQRNPGTTEIEEIEGRGHSLTIDSGWPEVADTALAFVERFLAP
jgi:pimeloyl-ACP methyl ester carboxylesterase